MNPRGWNPVVWAAVAAFVVAFLFVFACLVGGVLDGPGQPLGGRPTPISPPPASWGMLPDAGARPAPVVP